MASTRRDSRITRSIAKKIASDFLSIPLEAFAKSASEKENLGDETLRKRLRKLGKLGPAIALISSVLYEPPVSKPQKGREITAQELSNFELQAREALKTWTRIPKAEIEKLGKHVCCIDDRLDSKNCHATVKADLRRIIKVVNVCKEYDERISNSMERWGEIDAVPKWKETPTGFKALPRRGSKGTGSGKGTYEKGRLWRCGIFRIVSRAVILEVMPKANRHRAAICQFVLGGKWQTFLMASECSNIESHYPTVDRYTDRFKRLMKSGDTVSLELIQIDQALCKYCQDFPTLWLLLRDCPQAEGYAADILTRNGLPVSSKPIRDVDKLLNTRPKPKR